ncbi:Uncharacterised protein [Mycobacteroides abscessus subsp. massiliense]|nr:Uncharacterised protein [Mycobacteroides abscessus subsp. massiliense]
MFQSLHLKEKRMQIIEKTGNLINLKNLNKSIIIEKRILIVMKLMALSMILIQQVIIAYMKHHPNNTMSKYKSYKMIFILRTQTMLKLTIQMKLAIKVI